MAEQNPKHRRKPAGIGRIEGRITADGPDPRRPLARARNGRAGVDSSHRRGDRDGASAAWSGASWPRSAPRRRCASGRYFPTARSTPIAKRGRSPSSPSHSVRRAPRCACSRSVRSACSNRISTATSTSKAISRSRSAPRSTRGSTIRRTRWSRCATAGTNSVSPTSRSRRPRPTPGFTTTSASLSTSSGSTASA